MPRLFREAPLNSVWEGTGNINALDVLRAYQGRAVLAVPETDAIIPPEVKNSGVPVVVSTKVSSSRPRWQAPRTWPR